MARPISVREVQTLQPPPAQPDIATQSVPYWQPPKGLDYLSRINRIDSSHFSQIRNMWLDRGILRSRYGTRQVGDQIGDPVMAVVNFVMGSGVGFIFMVTTKTIYVLNASDVWTSPINAGNSFTGGVNDYFTFTAFNDSLLMSNGVDGIWEYNPNAGSFQRIVGAPSAKQLTTFGGRVLASYAEGIPTRIQWSVKNNSHDWDGEGSGFEDLLSTPGGQIDQQAGVWPLTEGLALVVRSNSIWQMTETGVFDVPFRFSRLYDNLGTRSPRSVDAFPGGIFLYGTDDIYKIDDRSITAIGTLIKDRVQAEQPDMGAVHGVYSPKTKEYLLLTGASTVYRYSLQDAGWAKSVYPFSIRSLEESVYHLGSLTIDELQGTIDSLVGTIDSLTGAPVHGVVYFGTADALGRVMAQDPELSTDEAGQDSLEVATGSVVAGDFLKRTTINEIQLEYEAAEQQSLTVEYSTNNGVDWNTYDTRIITPTDTPSLVTFRQTLSASNIMLRLTAPTIGRLIIIGLYPQIFQAERVHP